MRWFRVYNEVIDDPKIHKMNAKIFKTFIFMMCFASECEQNGKIPCTSREISVRIRTRHDTVKATIEKLIDLQILANDSNGYKFLNWEKRQFKSDLSTERVQRFRNVTVTANETPPEQNRTEHIKNRDDETLHETLQKPENPKILIEGKDGKPLVFDREKKELKPKGGTDGPD
jgi:hypothetical protein